MTGRVFTFTPRWKEELVVSCPDGTFILDFPMGDPTAILPGSAIWPKVTPGWAHDRRDAVLAELRAWCSANGVRLEIGED